MSQISGMNQLSHQRVGGTAYGIRKTSTGGGAKAMKSFSLTAKPFPQHLALVRRTMLDMLGRLNRHSPCSKVPMRVSHIYPSMPMVKPASTDYTFAMMYLFTTHLPAILKNISRTNGDTITNVPTPLSCFGMVNNATRHTHAPAATEQSPQPHCPNNTLEADDDADTCAPQRHTTCQLGVYVHPSCALFFSFIYVITLQRN